MVGGGGAAATHGAPRRHGHVRQGLDRPHCPRRPGHSARIQLPPQHHGSLGRGRGGGEEGHGEQASEGVFRGDERVVGSPLRYPPPDKHARQLRAKAEGPDQRQHFLANGR